LHNTSPNGVHYLIEFYGCDRKQLNSVTFWKRTLMQSISDTSMKMLHSHFYKFTPEGLTGYILISTSHISVHTWPELNYAACDVFICSGDDEGQSIVKFMRENLKHDKAKTRRIKRGYKVQTGQRNTSPSLNPSHQGKEITHPCTPLKRGILTPLAVKNNKNFFISLAGKKKTPSPHKFCTKNPDKLRLAKMAFFHGRNKKGEAIFNYRTIIDCTHSNGKQFSQIKTLRGDNFVDFHHKLLFSCSSDIEIFDLSAWYQTNGKKAKEYYRHFLAFFICNSVLF